MSKTNGANGPHETRRPPCWFPACAGLVEYGMGMVHDGLCAVHWKEWRASPEYARVMKMSLEWKGARPPGLDARINSIRAEWVERLRSEANVHAPAEPALKGEK